MKQGKLSRNSWILLAMVIFMVSLACKLNPLGQKKPVETIPVSTEAAGTLDTEIKQAVEKAQSGSEVDVSISEAELTSYLTYRLQEHPEVQFSSPQIYLRDGKAQVFIDYKINSIIVPLKVVFTPQVDSQGKARLVLETLTMGSVAVPDALEKSIQEEIDRSFAQALLEAGDNFFVESLTIQDGFLKLRGIQR